MDIKVRPNLHEANFSHGSRGGFRTLDAIVGYGDASSPSHYTQIAGPGPVANAMGFLGQEVHFRQIKRNHHPKLTTIGNFPRECADIAGMYVHMYICSSAAHEYWGNQRELSLRYAHLDLAIIEVKNFDAVTGLLPELWGMQPMSETTKKYVKKQDTSRDKVDTIGKGPPVTNTSKVAWAGGIGMEEVQ